MITFPDDLAIKVDVYGEGHLVEGDGTVAVTAIMNRQRSGDQFRRAARALLKMGLCLACYGHGHQSALHPEWNRLRRIIGGESYEGYVLEGPFDIFKLPHMQANLMTDVPGMTVAAQLLFGGLNLMVDMEPGPASQEVRAWADREGYRIVDITPKPGRPQRRLPSAPMTVKVHVDINYEIESDDPAAEEVGMRLLDDEAQAFAVAIRDRFAEAGIEIKQFASKLS